MSRISNKLGAGACLKFQLRGEGLIGEGGLMQRELDRALKVI